MKKVEIEEWAIRVADAVRRGEHAEDSTVEMKADWIDPVDAARRIAGHANAAGGSPILWLIGLDEKRGVVHRSNVDPATWWSQVVTEFDEDLSPTMTDVMVHVTDAETVVALCMETDRAPYVVKNKDASRVHREVPWRAATGIRTAKRSELVRILVPAQAAPRLEIESADLFAMATEQLGAGTGWCGRPFLACGNAVLHRRPGELRRLPVPADRGDGPA